MWGNGNIPLFLVGLQIYTSPLEINLGFSQKNLEIVLPQVPPLPFLGIYPNMFCHSKNTCSLHYYVHHNLFHNIQILEKTQMSLKRRMDTENMIHFHNGILLSFKNTDIMNFAGKNNQNRKHHPESGNLDPKGHAWYILT
jgi:hypothetical protein